MAALTRAARSRARLAYGALPPGPAPGDDRLAAPTAWTFRSGQKPQSIDLEPYLAVNSHGVLCRLAAAGAGIARLPAIHVADALAARAVRELLRPFAPPRLQPYSVYPSARNVSPALRAMLDVLSEGFKRRRGGRRSELAQSRSSGGN